MPRWTLLLSCLLLTACASRPPAPPTADLFHDALFAPPSQPVNGAEVFALNAAMRRYVDVDISSQLRAKGLQQGLLDALYRKQQLQLVYDSERTRNAAETFDARMGNCLSLVIMTAAFAKHLGLSVEYQSVFNEETWTRTRDTYFGSGHVNLVIGAPVMRERGIYDARQSWTVDFLPPEETQGQRTRTIGETTVLAMYMNNRAAEALSAGRLDDAYAWARAAVERDPEFTAAYNTLGVVYLRHGNPVQAEQALARALARAPASTVVMANLSRALRELGRTEESRQLVDKLARLEPEPPYHFFDLGQAALRSGDVAAARDWFAREVARAPYHHEFHFWLAVADLRLGRVDEARKHLTLAMENSTTLGDQRLYAAKLDRLKAAGLH